ncbi:MAG: FkbM family methyltransferase [Ardenticatenaceae bacterium]
MLMLLRRWLYYLRSLPTLLTGITNWPSVIALFAGLPVATPLAICLRPTGLRLKVRSPMDVWIVKENCLDRDYERVGVPIRDGWKIIDVGAGIGDFALDAAIQHPTCDVHAYEPFPGSFGLLRENLRLNALANVTAFAEAISTGVASIAIDISSEEAVQHRVAAGGAARTITVPAITLKQALARLDGPCDLLKMDCEGAEYDILLTADDESFHQLCRIVMEYHDEIRGHTHRELVAALEAKGFQVTCYPSSVQPHLGFLYASRTID